MQVLQIGCGALGQKIAEATLNQGHALTVVRRSALAAPTGARSLQIDVTNAAQCQQLASLQPQIVLYCLAPSEGSDQAYQHIYYQGLANVLQAVSKQALLHVFFISSTRVYGEHAGEWVDDLTPAMPADTGGHTLLNAERLLQDLPCGHTACRVSGIYGMHRRYLIQMANTPSRWPQQASWTNRIHEDDVVGAVLHFYQQVARSADDHASHNHGLPTQLIVSDGAPSLQHEVLQWVAVCMGWPAVTTPPAQPQIGKRLRNQCLLNTGYRLQYADFKQGYTPILQAMIATQSQIEQDGPP